MGVDYPFVIVKIVDKRVIFKLNSIVHTYRISYNKCYLESESGSFIIIIDLSENFLENYYYMLLELS